MPWSGRDTRTTPFVTTDSFLILAVIRVLGRLQGWREIFSPRILWCTRLSRHDHLKSRKRFYCRLFCKPRFANRGWIGGSDNRDSGVWEWTAGPEGGNTTSAGTDDSDRMQFWGNAGTSSQPVNLTGTAITGSPPTSGPAQLSGSVGCAASDAACCEDQYPAYHGQTPEQATAAADELGQTVVLKHHFLATQNP